MSGGRRLSIVIPTLDAAARLPVLLSDLRKAPFALEIILVDGGSRDDTCRLAAEAGCRLLTTEAGRGRQLARGAEAARGDWLLFLHADSRLPQEWHQAVARFMAERPAGEVAAYFRLALDSPLAAARRVERLAAWRARCFALPYGDQGLLISRGLYDKVGGYPRWPLMEDVALIRRLGRARLEALPATILTSAARYEREGWWRRPLRNLSCLALYFLGASPTWIARRYYRSR